MTLANQKALTLILALPLLLFTACSGDDQLARFERQDAFVYAAMNGNLRKVKESYAEGVDINATAGFEGCTVSPALIEAAGGGHLEVVKFLLDKGADINVRSWNSNETPIMSATWSGHAKVIKVFIEKGADVNAVDSKGRTALTIATDKKHSEIIEMLKQAGAKK